MKKTRKHKNKVQFPPNSKNDRQFVESPLAPFTRKDLAEVKTLDDLLAFAERYAEHHMRTTGSLPMTLFMLTPERLCALKNNSIAEEDKDRFAAIAKVVCVVNGATACLFAAEAWSVPTEQLKEGMQPSEHPERCEIVTLSGESKSEGQKQKSLPIIRSDDGKFTGFGQAEVSAGPLIGRFASFLPTTAPDEATRKVAKAMLKMKRVGSGKLG